MDVVLNHFGSPNGLGAIDAPYYYRVDPQGELTNWSGCGNDVRAEAPMFKRLVHAALRHWTETLGVDGVRLDLAELLGTPLLREIEADFRVRAPHKILIAEPWSFRGHAARDLDDSTWTSWDDAFREFLPAYVRGHAKASDLLHHVAACAIRPSARLRYAQSHDDMAWLDRITDARDLLAAQLRRASIMARQGRVDDARKLIADVPARDESQARSKLLAEVQLLRENNRMTDAFALLAQALQKEPRDIDLLYEQSMVAEKLGRFDDMERLLRELIALRPDHQHAYNALGYSLADRNVRLEEARTLIRKALELSPGDASITDSLGWVEYRMGNTREALRLLDEAYRKRPDPEIAAHLGEVLWQLGQRDRARAVWKEGLLLNAANETLRETLKRFGVSP
ncbi:MAG: hypothetical protein EBS39_11630 [Gammaproteobacteria bacterium]|nr:hypothetical protein [Gammaproteobacteria bacterium]